MKFIFKKISNFLNVFLLFISLAFVLANVNDIPRTNGLIPVDKYIVDESGNLMMNVNIWGHVKKPGQHLVYNGIDLTAILSVAGGPLQGANLNKIKIYRKELDHNSKLKYEINLNNFILNGDRSEFIEILPNDTIVVEQNRFSYFLSRTNTLTPLLQILNIYLQIKN